MNCVISVLVNNKTGVLNRITALFMRKGFNIQNITVGIAETEGQSRMTITVSDVDDLGVEQVMKQLHKQIDVLKVTDMTNQPMMIRELALIRVNSPQAQRAMLTTLIDPFRAAMIDVGRDTVTVQVAGRPEKVDALIALLQPYGIKELARTGITALVRDTHITQEALRVKANTLTI